MMGLNVRLIRLLFLTIFAALLSACTGLGGEPLIVATEPQTFSQSQPQTQGGAQNVTTSLEGAVIYAERCASCHGITGKGDGEVILQAGAPIPDFTNLDTVVSQTLDEYFEVITNGRLDKLMPPWKDALSEEQRWAVAQYVYDMGHGGGDSQAAAPAGDGDDASAAPLPAGPEITEMQMDVTGKVLNGTADAAAPGGLEITLHAVNAAFEEETFKTTANEDGTFVFDDVTIYNDRVYVATTNYGGVTFASPMIAGEPEKGALDLAVTVYEMSSDPAAVQMDSLTSQITVEGERLYVVQLVTLVNTGSSAYQGAAIPLPEGAQAELIGEGRYTVSEDGRAVIDSRPVVPNMPHTLHIAYSYPYSGETRINQALPYDAPNGYEVIIASKGIEVSGPNMFALGGRNTGMSFGTTVSQEAGSPMEFVVTGFPEQFTTDQSMPVAGVSTGGVTPLAYVLIAAGVLFIGAAGVLFVRERRGLAGATAHDGQAQVNALVKEIAALDVKHQNGQISEAAYQKRRSTLKAQLLALAQKSSGEQAQSK